VATALVELDATETALTPKRPWIEPVLARYESLALEDAPVVVGDTQQPLDDEVVAQVGSGIGGGPGTIGSGLIVLDILEGR
jgi:hypothetical protein